MCRCSREYKSRQLLKPSYLFNMCLSIHARLVGQIKGLTQYYKIKWYQIYINNALKHFYLRGHNNEISENGNMTLDAAFELIQRHLLNNIFGQRFKVSFMILLWEGRPPPPHPYGKNSENIHKTVGERLSLKVASCVWQ